MICLFESNIIQLVEIILLTGPLCSISFAEDRVHSQISDSVIKLITAEAKR